MKKSFFLVLITCFLFACGDNAGLIPSVNEPSPATQQELIPVTFNVGFTQEVIPLRASSDEPIIKYLEYLVFVAENEYDIPGTVPGMLYKQRTFNFEGSIFDGNIRDSLPAGDYVFVFAANNESPFLFTGNNLFEGVSMTTNQSTVPEVFYIKTPLTVDNRSGHDKSTPLRRTVGKVEIVLEDILPEDVDRIEIKVEPMGYTYFIYSHYYGIDGYQDDNWTIMSGSLSYSYPVASNENRVMPPYSFLSYENLDQLTDENGFHLRTPVTITIQAYSGNTLITEKQINNVDILMNRTVRYTGHLFENIAFSLSVDERWTGTSEETF
jgi:hypothetical protein